MRTAVFIAVRMGSTRLPKKALLEIKGKPVIEHLIDRVKTAKLPQKIVICTTTAPEDQVLTQIAQRNGVHYFRGSEDKLLRFLNAAKRQNVDFLIIVDGDDIFCDPEFIDRTAETFMQTHADFIAWKDLPLGATPHGIKFEALEKVCEIKDVDVEVYGPYFTDTGLFKVKILRTEDAELRRPEIRMTLDYPEDYEFLKVVFNELYEHGKIFSLREILALLKRKPQLAEINKHLEETYFKRIQKQSKIKLKKNYKELLHTRKQ